MTAPATADRLMRHLPAIYREDAFLGRYLWAFEQILLGLEETIDNLARFFDPKETPEEFLPWLASWTAFTLRADLDASRQRDFIVQIIPLYRRRGTKRNLQDLLAIFTRGVPTVTETAVELQVGVHSTIGRDTFVGGGSAHFFRVTIRMPKLEAKVVLRQREIAHALIELEKPAHTHYALDVVFPTMRIARSSTVGVDTLLGTGTDTD